MKRIVLIALAFLLCTCCAYAHEDAYWYELSAENTVLTVGLTQIESGSWTFETSDALELITLEDGQYGFVASFRAVEAAENAEILLQRTSSGGETLLCACTLSVNENLAAKAVDIRLPYAHWCEFSDENRILTLRAENAAWNFEIADPEIVDLITCDDSDGAFVASFMALKNGQTEITLHSLDGLSSRSVLVSADESGKIQVLHTEETVSFEE